MLKFAAPSGAGCDSSQRANFRQKRKPDFSKI